MYASEIMTATYSADSQACLHLLKDLSPVLFILLLNCTCCAENRGVLAGLPLSLSGLWWVPLGLVLDDGNEMLQRDLYAMWCALSQLTSSRWAGRCSLILIVDEKFSSPCSHFLQMEQVHFCVIIMPLLSSNKMSWASFGFLPLFLQKVATNWWDILCGNETQPSLVNELSQCS